MSREQFTERNLYWKCHQQSAAHWTRSHHAFHLHPLISRILFSSLHPGIYEINFLHHREMAVPSAASPCGELKNKKPCSRTALNLCKKTSRADTFLPVRAGHSDRSTDQWSFVFAPEIFSRFGDCGFIYFFRGIVATKAWFVDYTDFRTEVPGSGYFKRSFFWCFIPLVFLRVRSV